MVQLRKSPPHALHIDAALFCFARTNLAEASHVARIDRRLIVRGARERPKAHLPLACPYNPVDLFDLFGQPVVFNPTGQEIPPVRIVAWWHINHAFVQAPNEFLP